MTCPIKPKDRPTCLECGKTLNPHRVTTVGGVERWQFGGYGDDLFCGLNCGYRWALMMAHREIKADSEWIKRYRAAFKEAKSRKP